MRLILQDVLLKNTFELYEPIGLCIQFLPACAFHPLKPSVFHMPSGLAAGTSIFKRAGALFSRKVGLVSCTFTLGRWAAASAGAGRAAAARGVARSPAAVVTAGPTRGGTAAAPQPAWAPRLEKTQMSPQAVGRAQGQLAEGV